ncbi:MAG: hypothetical protein ACW98F_07115 [Candidatus Hodarchaeales archaeon]
MIEEREAEEKKGDDQLLDEMFLDESIIEMNDLIFNPQKQKLNTVKLSNQLPLEYIFPDPLPSSKLTPTEQKIYLQLAIEFDMIQRKTISFREGKYSFSQIIDDRLQHYGLTRDTWDDIASRGDQDKQLQYQFHQLTEKIQKILMNYKNKYRIKAPA